jgi:hypothetical protein
MMMISKRYVAYIFVVLALSGIMNPGKADAGIDVNVNIGFPPAIVIPAAPEVVLIPGINAYFIPDIDVDIIFHNGYWYRPHKGNWFRATSYNGPWINIVRAEIPVALLKLPPDYRHVPPGQSRIPYGQLKKTWEAKEKAAYRSGSKHKNKKGKGKGRWH